MTNRALFLVIMSSVLAATPQAHAGRPASDLNRACQSLLLFSAEASGPAAPDGMDEWRAGLCTGFVAGWVQAVDDSYMRTEEGRLLHIEILPGVTANRVGKLLPDYLKKHPDRNGDSAGRVLVDVLGDAGLIRVTDVTGDKTGKLDEHRIRPPAAD